MECLFFINPRSGTDAGKQLSEEIENFHFPSVVSKQVVFTDPERLESQVYSCASGKDLVIICGGDGTINSIIACLSRMDPAPAAAFIPLGTGNDIARATGWYLSWKKMGLDGIYHAIKRGKTTSLDIWELSADYETGNKKWIFCAYAGLGCDGRICSSFSRMERAIRQIPMPQPIRKFFYIIPGLSTFFADIAGGNKFLLQLDGPVNNHLQSPFRAAQLLFLNVSSYAGGTMRLERIDHSDGKLDAFLFRSCLSYVLAILFSKLPGTSGPAAMGAETCFRFNILEDVFLQVDGEVCGRLPEGSRCVIRQQRSLPLLKPLKDDLARNRSSAGLSKKYAKSPAGAAKPIVT